jgi:uncharacterized protein involved in outer membrane biogenesis
VNNFLVAIAVFLIAVLGAAFAIPRVVHWESYRGVIEEESTRILGRDVRIGGAVRISLLPSPTFSVEKIRIADTEANTGEPFFQAEALRGRLAIAPLLRGIFQANEMVLSKPLLHLVLDGQGGGNWKTLAQGNGQLPFQFSDVALDQVKIEGGSLSVFGADRAERLRLENVDGILSAQALDGPFRFRGFFGLEPARRELRFSTGKQEADGSLRFKAGLRQVDTGANYNFDARAVDLARAPRVEGELAASVPLPKLTVPNSGANTGAGTTAARPTEIDAPVEVKAALSADLKLVKLANLTLAFERQGRPQTLTGDATIDVSKAVSIDAKLAAKWLDLDQIIGVAPPPGQDATSPQTGPIEGLLNLAQRLNGFTPDQGQATLTLDVEQANLGREAVSGVRLALQGTGAETDIRELRLGLPGGAQADVKGLMTGSGEETSFSGDIVLRGSSLTRFLGWSTGGAIALDPGRDGAFAMRARLVAAPGTVVAREFTGELAGTIMQGELGYRWQGRPEVSVLIEGPRVDLRAVLSEQAGRPLSSLVSYLTAGSTFGAQAAKTDAVLRVRAGELLVPGAAFVDAAADLEMRDGRLRVSQLRLAADHGVTIDVDGDLPAAGSAERGTLRGTISAKAPEGIRQLADLLAIPASLRPTTDQLANFAPLRVAGSVSFGTDETAPLDVSGDGDIAGTRITGKGRFDKGLTTWRAAPLDAAVSFRGPRGLDLARTLFGAAPRAGDAGSKTAASSILVHVTGTPRDGLITQATLADAKPRLTFVGRTNLDDTRGVSAAGDLAFDAADTATALALFAPTFRPSLPTSTLSGRARLDSKSDSVRLDRIDASIAGVPFSGELEIASAEARVRGRLTAATLPIATVLQPMLGQRRSERPGAIWSTAQFDDKAINDIAADLDIKAGRLTFPGGLALSDTRMTIAFSRSRLDIRDLEGRGGGGLWSGGLRLDSAKDGVTMTTALRLKDVQVASLRAANANVPPVDSSVSGLITFNGRGETVHDAIAAATGKGSLASTDSRLALLDPTALTGILQTALRGPAEGLSATLRQSLAAYKAPSATIAFPARAFEIDIRNGVATLSPVGVENVDGKVLGNAAIDLTALTLNATWRVEAAGDVLPPPPGWTTTVNAAGAPIPRKAAAPLPPVVLTLNVPLAALDQGKLDINTDALEREVAVRKVERDLEDLERLRKLDEERAKDEVERRRALENGALPSGGAGVAIPAAAVPRLAVDPSTEATAVPDTVDPAAKPKSATPAAAPTPVPQPAPKPAVRPLNSEEHRKIFGGG